MKYLLQMILVLCMGIPAIAIKLVWSFPQLWIFDLSKEYLFWGGLSVALVALFLMVFNWRCPECHGYLGNEPRPRKCPNCGIVFGKYNDEG